MKINNFLDATYLKTAINAGISEKENLKIVLSLTNEAIKYNYKLLMIRANYITIVRKKLRQAKSITLIGTVIGFPEGIISVSEKLEEAQKGIDLGVDELDFVINYKEFKKGNFVLIEEEVIKCTKLCLENQASVFAGICNIYAPYYRQMHIYGYTDTLNGYPAFHLAYNDVLEAFKYFITHINNENKFIGVYNWSGELEITSIVPYNLDFVLLFQLYPPKRPRLSLLTPEPIFN
mgnify:CR=1 FL=1